jgi:hypothetical protein
MVRCSVVSAFEEILAVMTVDISWARVPFLSKSPAYTD